MPLLIKTPEYMKILVIGASGQLARSLVNQGAKNNQTLHAMGRSDIDLTQATSVKRSLADISPDLIINAAAYTAVDKAETNAGLAFSLNDIGPGLLAEHCGAAHIPLIHISTDYVFDGEKPDPYREDDPVAPIGVYGHSKRAGELRVTQNCAKHIVLRTAWVFSPFGQNFVKTMLQLAGERLEIGVVDDQVGNPTYAPHLADCILNIAQNISANETGDVPWGIYHAAGTGDASWYDLAREVFNQSVQLGGPSAIVHPITSDQYPAPARRPSNSRLDCSKLANAFGIELPKWQIGVKECLVELTRNCVKSVQ